MSALSIQGKYLEPVFIAQNAPKAVIFPPVSVNFLEYTKYCCEKFPYLQKNFAVLTFLAYEGKFLFGGYSVPIRCFALIAHCVFKRKIGD